MDTELLTRIAFELKKVELLEVKWFDFQNAALCIDDLKKRDLTKQERSRALLLKIVFERALAQK